MKLVIYLTSLLFAAADRSCTDYTNAERSKALLIINQLRQSIKPTPQSMPVLTWNYPLGSAIRAYLNTVGDEWVFRTDTNCPIIPGYGHKMAGMCLLEQPMLTDFSNCRLINHDTNKNTGRISKVLHFRAIQAHCFDYNACSTIKFNGYKSCNNSELTLEHAPNGCEDFWPYIGNFVRDDLKSIAVIPIDAKGTFSPSTQSCSFWIYGCGDGPNIPANDIPYRRKVLRS